MEQKHCIVRVDDFGGVFFWRGCLCRGGLGSLHIQGDLLGGSFLGDFFLEENDFEFFFGRSFDTLVFLANGTFGTAMVAIVALVEEGGCRGSEK